MACRSIIVACLLAVSSAQNNRPIIGILSMPNDNTDFKGKSFFPASYVKWVESGGARVVPIMYSAPLEETAALLAQINGALFTGGGASFQNKNFSLTHYATTAQLVFNTSVAAAAKGETWPVWGTCLGMQLLSLLASANWTHTPVLSGFDSENLTLPLTFAPAAATSRLWGNAGDAINKILSTEPVTMNNHHDGVIPSTWNDSPLLGGRFNILSTNVDRVGREFVSSFEGKTLPIYATQFHPEKPSYEWYIDEGINHSFDSITANHYPVTFFVNEARKNSRQFSSPDAEAAALIYNYQAVYTEADTPGFEQTYFFDQ